jgi:hypothetical protein
MLGTSRSKRNARSFSSVTDPEFMTAGHYLDAVAYTSKNAHSKSSDPVETPVHSIKLGGSGR